MPDAIRPDLRNRGEETPQTVIAAFAIEQSGYGQVRVYNALHKRGFFVSPSGVRSDGPRLDLNPSRSACIRWGATIAKPADF